MQMLVTSNIDQLLTGMSVAKIKLVGRAIGIVRRLTKYAKKKMKYYAPSRSQRATGSLKGSITSKIAGGTNIRGIAFVPRKIKQQFVIEFGRKYKHKHIRGNPLMKFSVADWKKGQRNASIMRLSRNGFFYFTVVSQGKMKGKFFTKKAYEDLLKFYDNQKSKYAHIFANDLIISRY